MRTLLTLALVACAASPAAAQTAYYYQGQGRTTYLYPTYRSPVYATPQSPYATPQYNVVQPRMSYSYAPTTYSQPTYSTYSYPQTYSYPSTTYTTPTVYSSTPTYTYSRPAVVYSTPTYTQPTYWSQPTASWSSYPTTMAFRSSGYGPSQYGSSTWSQPTYYTTPSYYSTPTMTYSFAPSYRTQTTPVQDVIVTNPFQTQPTLNFVPSGNYDQRLMTSPSYAPRYAGRRTYNPYR
jgi:hypothetical protein